MLTDNFKNRSPVTVGAAFRKAGFQVQYWSQAADGALTEMCPPTEEASDTDKTAFDERVCKQGVVIVQATKE